MNSKQIAALIIVFLSSCGGGNSGDISSTDSNSGTNGAISSESGENSQLQFAGLYYGSYSKDYGTSCYGGYCSTSRTSHYQNIVLDSNFNFFVCVQRNDSGTGSYYFGEGESGSDYDNTNKYGCYKGTFTIDETYPSESSTLLILQPTAKYENGEVTEANFEEFDMLVTKSSDGHYTIGNYFDNNVLSFSNDVEALGIKTNPDDQRRYTIKWRTYLNNLNIYFDTSTQTIETGKYITTFEKCVWLLQHV